MGALSPLIISLHQSGIYGQSDPDLTSLLSLNFEVGVLLPANSGIKKAEEISPWLFLLFFVYNSNG
ncbi:hypothetical protein AT269_16705 [Bacillus cereus]|nr:hypothetical protein AT269_16705 [Bacillus cereus]